MDLQNTLPENENRESDDSWTSQTQKYPLPILASGIFLALVILICWALFLFNLRLSYQIEDINTQIQKTNQEYTELIAKEPRLKNFRSTLSAIDTIEGSFSWKTVSQNFTNFLALETQYEGLLNWFSFDGSKITSQISFASSSTSSSSANTRALRFLQAYSQPIWPHWFRLGRVNTLWWNDQERILSVEFTLP